MQPQLFIVRGPVGVGKSSVTKALRQRVGNASVVEPDAIKRMIDPHQSSTWRRAIAHDTAAFIAEQLIRSSRSAIVEAHTKYPDEIQRYTSLANSLGISVRHILLTAPFEVCLARAGQRQVPDITYDIDEQMVRSYYCNLDPRPGDLAFDTSTASPEQIAQRIALAIHTK